MTAKQITVNTMALPETMKRYFVMVVPMSAAVANESPCESAIPSAKPTTSDAHPTIMVSSSRMRLTRPALMPNMRYVPNSRRRRLIRNRLAYTTRNPKTHTITPESKPIMVFSISSI